MNEFELYTPQELIEAFPFLTEMGWTATKVGILFAMGLLKGKKVDRKALISLKSFNRFLEFYNEVHGTNYRVK